MKKEAFIKTFISIYLFMLAVATWVNSVGFWQREKVILAFIGTTLSLLLFISIISYFTNKKPLLVVNIISLIAFTIYFIGGFIWFMLTDYSSVLFALIMMILILPINLCVIFYTKGKIENFNQV
jgi:hypothetical protein